MDAVRSILTDPEGSLPASPLAFRIAALEDLVTVEISGPHPVDFHRGMGETAAGQWTPGLEVGGSSR